MATHQAFQSLLLLTLLALAVPLVVRQLKRFVRLPIVVGEIIAGIIVGQSGFNLVHETPVLAFLADFGFIFLMFLSGVEVNFSALGESRGRRGAQSIWQRPAWLAAINFTLTLAVATAVGFALWKSEMTKSPILMGLILSTTSLGIVVPVLKERELLSKPYGQSLLISALLSDFITLLLLGLLISYIKNGFGPDMLFFVALLIIFIGAAKVGRWANRHALTRRVLKELSHATAQIRVRGAFALIVVWVVLAGSLGLEVILGAFLAGAIIGQNRQRTSQIFEEKLDAMGYGFFIPLFFIMVGARFDLKALIASPGALWLVPLLIAASYLVKLLPALCFAARFTWRESFAGGLLLASRLSLIIAASSIALNLGLITSGVNSAIILLAIFTCTASPTLFNRVLPATREKKRRGVIILGTDSLAELLGKRLLQDGEPVIFIGRDAARLDKLKETGCNIVSGPPDDEQILTQAGADQARALVALSNDPDVVLRACRQAREQFKIPSVVARAELPDHVKALQALKVRVVQPAMAMAIGLEGALNFPSAMTLLSDRSDEFDLADATLGNPELMDVPLRQVHLPGQALVLGVRRRGEGEVVVPHGDTVLREGDVIMLCGNPKALAEASRWIAGR